MAESWKYEDGKVNKKYIMHDLSESETDTEEASNLAMASGQNRKKKRACGTSFSEFITRPARKTAFQRRVLSDPIWPKELHIDFSPEFLYQPTNKQELFVIKNNPISTPSVPSLSSSNPLKVYENPSAKVISYEAIPFSSMARSQKPNLEPFYKLESEKDETLLFESRFESGNLGSVYKIGPYEYDMYVREDINTKGHTQWYFFKISNTKANLQYTFHIKNFLKTDSLYRYGLQPLMYSEKGVSLKGEGWKRIGENITYMPNFDAAKTHCLTFSFTLPYSEDSCYFAHCYPFTYKDLQKHLDTLINCPERGIHIRHKVIGNTLAHNNLDLLTITTATEKPEDLISRSAIVVSARVHPGETNSSWMMKGFLDFITSSHSKAKYLRDNHIFKVIPMLNPDGVIVGNYRCGLSGYDLNRCWKNPKKEISPEIYYAKKVIEDMQGQRKVEFFVDIHGHSRKHGVFMYGCNNNDDSERRYLERVFPYMLSKKAQDLFFFKKCQFTINKRKEGTARIVVRKVFQVINSFTLEASFCGSPIDDTKGFQYSTLDLERMGRSFGETLHDYFYEKKEDVKVLHSELKQQFEKNSPDVLPESSSSDSDTSDDEELRLPIERKRTISSKKKIAAKAKQLNPVESIKKPCLETVSPKTLSRPASSIPSPRLITSVKKKERAVSADVAQVIYYQSVTAKKTSEDPITIGGPRQMEVELRNAFTSMSMNATLKSIPNVNNICPPIAKPSYHTVHYTTCQDSLQSDILRVSQNVKTNSFQSQSQSKPEDRPKHSLKRYEFLEPGDIIGIKQLHSYRPGSSPGYIQGYENRKRDNLTLKVNYSLHEYEEGKLVPGGEASVVSLQGAGVTVSFSSRSPLPPPAGQKGLLNKEQDKESTI